MKVKTIAFSVAAVAVVGVIGYRSCTHLSRPDLARMAPSDVRDALPISDPVNELGFKMLRYYYSKLGAKNIVVSPLSLMSSSAVAANLYDDPARSEILKALGCTSIGLPNKSLPSWVSKEMQSAKSPISVSNGLFLRAPLKPDSKLETLLKGAYGCTPIDLMANNAKARDQVSDWIDAATKGLLKSSLPAFSNAVNCVTVNAIWFKCDWQFQFDKKKTRPEAFTRADGSKVTVDLMSFEKGAEVSHGFSPGRFVVLPYADGDFAMILAMPEDGKKLADLIKTLSNKTISEMLNAKPEIVRHAGVPRFEMSGSANLNPFLRKLGVSHAFEPQKARTLTASQPVMLTDAIQSTWIKVDEQGTEAATATEMQMSCSAGEPFYFTEPFVYAVYHKPTKTIIFLGLCADPTAKSAL